MPYTAGFRDIIDLREHYAEHGSDFGVPTEQEYLNQADAFLGGPRASDTLDCRRRCKDGSFGDYVRFNMVTHEFGVLSADIVIRTYYVPDPMRHRQVNNLAYFQAECRKVIC